MSDQSAEWQIGTVDLRRGLAAVLPHVNPDSEQPGTHRIRIEVSGELLLIATDGQTAGVYSTDAQHVRTFGIDYVDLSPADVAKILAVFKAGKDEDADYPESVVEFTCTEKLTKIRDVSGMFAGHELELPATPPGDFPNVAKLLAERLGPGKGKSISSTHHLVQVGGKALARFTASAKAIGAPVAIDTESTPFVITVGDVFAGLVMPIRMGDHDRDAVRDVQDRWRGTAERLAAVVTNRQAKTTGLSDLMVAAVKAIGVRQSATVTGLAEWISVDKATATDLLDQLHRAGLLGVAKRGRGREVMFSPEEVDRVLGTLAGDDDQGDDVEPELTVSEGQEVDWDAYAEMAADPPGETVAAPPESPFSDPPIPPSPFIDSDGHEWPTSPFGS